MYDNLIKHCYLLLFIRKVDLLTSYFLFFSVPECSNQIKSAEEDLKKAGSMCNINELFSCGENQVCVQLEPDNNMGRCQCLQGYDKQDDGVII